ncbi:HIT domain-containing protein [Sphaerisporangium sp. NPDC005288]|uniref:HIT family protein n=1 Tax=Sphaerisporangium sp. NPDC005288 TaxID=3155114 RepID=UPI0033B57DDB
MGECVFCAFLTGRARTAVLYEDEHTLAFLDITAVTRGHTLVIPRRHAADLWEISEDDAAAVMRTVHRMARRIREVLCPDGLTLFQANRAAGWQDVFHLHVHLVPRSTGDHLARPWRAEPVELATLEPTRELLALS